jgi:phage terminase large subunit GpA-like protein
LIAIRGRPGDNVPRIAKIRRERNEKRGTLLERSNRFYNIGVDQFKMAVYRDLAKDDPSMPGYVSFPSGCEDRLFQEMVSESASRFGDSGRPFTSGIKSERQANEALDMLYASAAAIKHGVNWISDTGWPKLESEWESPGPEPAPAEAAKPKRSIASLLAR